MAWQSMTGMGGGGNGGGGNGSVSEGSQQAAQPQGTEYTLQGAYLSDINVEVEMELMGCI